MITRRKFSQYWSDGQQGILAGILWLGFCQSSLAQIVPDNTLGGESSTVTPDNIRGIDSDRIDGGAIRGANLFHSFSQFNIGSGRGAYFANPAGIQNILSRVTGANRSEILGRLGVLGDANLFLMNPNGIVFGADASLDVQGAFLATTANAIKLGDTGLFSASQPTTSNLLSVSPSALWFNAVAASPIVNRSQALSLIGQLNSNGGSPGLQVLEGRTLALVGGDVLLEGGNLTAAAGRIELGSVADVGQVSLSQSENSLLLGYDAINSFGNIQLSNGAFVDTSGSGGGSVQIRGARLEMTQNSNIWANTLGAGNGKQVLVRTSEVVLGDGSALNADVTTGTGTGGDVRIETGRLLVKGGAGASATTYGPGKSGSLLINATDLVELIGVSADSQLPSSLNAQSAETGDAGELRIDTGRLIVRDGAQVSTSSFGPGKGGGLLINATDSVELIGISADGQILGGLFAGSRGSGDGGNLRINTQRLRVSGGAIATINTESQGKSGSLLINAADSVELSGTSANGQQPSGLFALGEGNGDAGDIRIDTGRLIVRDGARSSTSTFGSGKGGSLLINAADSVELSGTSANGRFLSALLNETRGSGNAGDVLRIDTGRLLVRDLATISSRSIGTGKAGNIDITARDTLQANNGRIRTNSTQSQGGAITVRAGKVRLFDNSDITTNVNSGAAGGGNIVLKAGSILAFGDSDILAFSQDGRGGNITLDTRAFFSENYRPAPPGTDLLTFNNNDRVDINATGAVSGIITLPDVSFIQNSLTELPDTQINTDSLLANSCIVRRAQPTQGSFTITGTGGLPQRPGEAQMSSFPTVNVETVPQSLPNQTWQKGDPIVEPQGVYRLPNGKLVLSRNCL